MTDTSTPDASPTEPSEQNPPPADMAGDGKDWRSEADKWKALARKHEKAAKELDELRQQTMSDTEKALAQARTEGRTEGLAAGAARLAAAEIRAAAAGRMGNDQLDALLEATNLAVFIDDNGEVDRNRVGKFVDGIAPKVEPGPQPFPDLGQGARGGTAGTLADDPLLRDVKAKLGIR